MSYEASKAARLISWSNERSGAERLSEKQLRDWVDAGVASLEWDDIWEGEKYIDFPTLISLRLIFQLHSHGVPLEAVTEAAPRLRQELGVKWPFANKRMWNYNFDLINLDEGKAFDHISKGLILCSEQLTHSGLEFDGDGVACLWRPATDVWVHPGIVSGSPCIAGTRIPTSIFLGILEERASIAEMVWAYGLTEDRVKNAMAWEKQLAASGV